MGDELDPTDWVDALEAFLEIAPWTPWAAGVIVAALLASMLIKAWRSGGSKDE